jgi:hypothetical protein
MKIRLMGTDAECAMVLVALRDYTPGLRVTTVNGPYLHRTDIRQMRLYIDAELLGTVREADK